MGITDVQLISQSWHGAKWTHRVRILVPEKILRPYIVLLVSGSGDGHEELVMCHEISRLTGMAVAVLHDVPNQPLFGDLYEDALMAYTFAEFLEDKGWDWPLLLPMVKSVVKAIDAIEEIFKGISGINASGFIVTGASRRGWTTWLAATVDRRIRGIAPMVYDNLNLAAQMKHQTECYGGYSEQISDFTSLGLQERLTSEPGKRLVDIIDPFVHKDELHLPKLLINGTNDRYWTIDSLNLYFDDLLGEKYVLYVPNSGHGLEDRRRVLNTLSAFALSVSKGSMMPRMKVEYSNSQANIEVSESPLHLDAWSAKSLNMDFRDSRWTSAPVEEIGLRRYRYELKPQSITAYFIESCFMADGFPYSLSSQICMSKS